MSSHRSRTHADRADSEEPSLPPVHPPPTDDEEGEGQDDVDDPRRGDGVLGSPGALVEAGRGPGVSQELVTAAVLDALSNPDDIGRLVAAVSQGSSEGSGASSSVATADSKFLSIYSCVFCGTSQLILAFAIVLLSSGASPLEDSI